MLPDLFDEADEDDTLPDADNTTPPAGSGPPGPAHVPPPLPVGQFATLTIPKPPEENNATSLPLRFDTTTINRLRNTTPSGRSQHELRYSLEYIALLREATLENSGLTPDGIQQLQEPNPKSQVDLEDDFDEKLSLDLFLSLQTYPDTVYTKVISILNKALPSLSLLSLYRVKNLTRKLSGVATVQHDMCPKSCIAYTGPLSSKTTCYECNTSRWDPKHKNQTIPGAIFTTITIGL